MIYQPFVENILHTQILSMTFLYYRHINGKKIQLKDLILIRANDIFVKYIVRVERRSRKFFHNKMKQKKSN